MNCQIVQHSYLICGMMRTENTTNPKQHSKYSWLSLPMKVCQFVADCSSKALIEAMKTSSGLETGSLWNDNLLQKMSTSIWKDPGGKKLEWDHWIKNLFKERRKQLSWRRKILSTHSLAETVHHRKSRDHWHKEMTITFNH